MKNVWKCSKIEIVSDSNYSMKQMENIFCIFSRQQADADACIPNVTISI